MKKTLTALAAAIIILMTGGPAHANQGAIINGVAWLEQSQSPSGSWGNTPTSQSTEFLSTAAAISALVSEKMGSFPTLYTQKRGSA